MGSNQRTIVIIEDDNFLRAMYEKKLSVSGFAVKAAANGEEGMEMCLNCNPDLIILDIMLPGMTGLEILKLLKENKKVKDIPVVIMSNFGTDDYINKGLSLGAVDYLIKSNFLPSEVIKKIEEILWKYKTNSI